MPHMLVKAYPPAALPRIGIIAGIIAMVGTAMLGTALAAPAADAAPKPIGKYAGWSSWELGAGKTKICYAVTDATAGRLPAHLMITHRPAEKTFDVVSVELNDALAENGSAAIAVGKHRFDFFTRGSSAWSRDAETDQTVVTAMTTASWLTANSETKKGGKLSVRYDLAGFPQALVSIDKACGVKR